MAEETGLRFDLREHVRVPDELPAIGDLEQVELLPFVEQVAGRHGPLLKGHLQLTAVYVPEGDGAVRTLTRQIPVDISLPARAAPREGDAGIAIEQFDVELASARSLNVTGVLALTGLPPGRAEADRADGGEEEIVAVHQAKKKKKPPVSETVQVVPGGAADESAFTAAPAEAPWPEDGGGAAEPAGALPHPYGDAAEEPAGETFAPAEEGPDAGGWPEGDAAPDGDRTVQAEMPAPAQIAAETPAPEPVAAEAAAANAPPAEPKVAFKPLEEAAEDDAQTAEAAATPGTKNNELEWQKLFLSGGGEEPFRKVRLCIVQKEETIDAIAERYRLNPREIALYNRLSDSNLAEGQILYIPLP